MIPFLESFYGKDQIQSAPAKWRKYLLLEYFGLISKERLSNEIHRFKFSMIDECQEELLRVFGKQNPRAQIFAVIKLVPMKRAGQLPNYVVRDLSEIEGVFHGIRRRQEEEWTEMWFCLSTISTETLSVSGRLIPRSEDSRAADVLEQIWNASPRMIETYGPALQFPYLRAERELGRGGFNVKQIRIPTGYPITESQMLSDYRLVISLLHERRDSWRLFVSHLLANGVKSVSLEYKLNQGDFAFIDWDSDNDTLVI